MLALVFCFVQGMAARFVFRVSNLKLTVFLLLGIMMEENTLEHKDLQNFFGHSFIFIFYFLAGRKILLGLSVLKRPLCQLAHYRRQQIQIEKLCPKKFKPFLGWKRQDVIPVEGHFTDLFETQPKLV